MDAGPYRTNYILTDLRGNVIALRRTEQPLDECHMALKNMLKWLSNTLEEILPTLSENPAKEMNLCDRKGSLETGKDADLVLLDEEANVVHVFARGKQVK